MTKNEELLRQLQKDIADNDAERAVARTQQALDGGIDVMEVVGAASAAMKSVGDQFQCGEIFLPGLMLAGKVMKLCVDAINQHIVASGGSALVKRGKIVVCAVRGDIHDIGKNLVASLLVADRYDVVDLGVDVDPFQVIDAAVREQAGVIALSALMTTSMPGQREVIKVLNELGLRDKFFVIVGGGPVTGGYAAEIGADGWGRSAVSAVRLCNGLLAGGQRPPLHAPALEE